ncbi:MAG: hypothetical protein R3E66_02455 [bacterium]
MAIAPRTILKNPALLALTTLAVGAVGAGGMLALYLASVSCQYPANVQNFDPCAYTVESSDTSRWTEREFVAHATCDAGMDNDWGALDTAKTGLLRYPSSEVLLNIRGYHEINLGLYDEAVDTLRNGVARVTPSNGVMENNLAWAGLWAPRKMDLREARALYTRSLERDPNSCEAVHTGMWVEYAIAAKEGEAERRNAIKRYDTLRDRYDGCERRLAEPSEDRIQEVLGAATLDFEMSKLAAANNQTKPAWARAHMSTILARSAMTVARSEGMTDVDTLCSGATPIGQTHTTCVQLAKAKPCR